jgi:hypothetical protein
MLRRKLKKALAGLEETKGPFESLTAFLPTEKVEEWKVQEEQAMLVRGDALGIFDVQLQKGNSQVLVEALLVVLTGRNIKRHLRLRYSLL